MSFRSRIAVGSAAAVALAVVAASVAVYLIAREQLRAPVDEALEARAAQIAVQRLGVIPGQGGDEEWCARAARHAVLSVAETDRPQAKAP